MPTLTLYSYWRSSSSWRVRIALHTKGLDLTTRPVHLVRDGGQQHADSFRALNPSAQIPLLAIDGGARQERIAQSIAIMEWLEELYPERPILPADPQERALCRSLAEIVNAGTQPLQNLAVLQHLKSIEVDARAWGRHWIERGLAAYQAWLPDDDRAFSVGDEPCVADFCLIPQLYNARRFDVDLAPFERLTAIERACAVRPAFAAAHPDAQPDFDPDAGP